MTNATDVLCIGGPLNGYMYCLNLTTVPPSVSLGFSLTPGYVARKWWNINLQRWYWIATTASDPVDDATIFAAVVVAQMQPAWDLKDLPAPSSNNTEES